MRGNRRDVVEALPITVKGNQTGRNLEGSGVESNWSRYNGAGETGRME